MKKAIVILSIFITLSTSANACSICKPIAEAWDVMIEYITKVQCHKSQMMWARVSGKYPPCEHNGKHQLYSK